MIFMQAAQQGDRAWADSLWLEMCTKNIAPGLDTLNQLMR